MKNLGAFAVSIFVGILVLSVASLPAWGQGENPPASTKEVGQTSGHGYTLVEQSMPESAEQQIRTLHDQARRAALRGDASFLEEHLAPNYLGIGGDGRERTKAESIQDLKSGAIKYESIDEHDVKVNTYGNTVVVNSMASVKLISNGKPVSGDYRATFVYVKQGGDWKEVAFQSTPVGPGGL
ncbi:MAG: nuclear transport factor 2 family protein [Terriglobales bacterium]